MANKRRAPRTAFGSTVARYLDEKRATQADIAACSGFTPQNVSRVVSGQRRATPRWADLVADVLALQAGEREELHRAAAHDQGFKLDLTKK